jgi:uncharacterized protein
VTGPVLLQPVFPLPNVVLFPKTLLPLHIFEPRYRLMTAEALAGQKTLCVALLKPGWETDYEGSPEVYPVGCVGRIVQHRQLPDGRYQLVLHGEEKVLIEGFERLVPYRIGRLRPVIDDAEWARSPGVVEESAALLELFRRASRIPGAAVDLSQIFSPHMSPEAILNSVAMHLDVVPETKQHLLEIESVGARYRTVLQILRGASTTQERIDRVRHLFPRDKRVN